MNSGRPKDQSLAISYSIKRKNAKKKMAQGGMVNDSAKMEHRPMPSERDRDSQIISQNSAMKAPSMDKMTSQPERMQVAPKKTMPLKHPRMAASDVLQVRLRDEEDHLMRMAEGGMLPAEDDMAPDMEVSRQDDEDMAPPVDEYMAKRMADGGMVDDEMEDEDDASIASAIMAKRRRMAEGGMVDIDSNNEEQPNGYYARNEDAALKENYDSDMDGITSGTNEDSPEHDEMDIEDASNVSAIRRKMKTRSPITR